MILKAEINEILSNHENQVKALEITLILKSFMLLISTSHLRRFIIKEEKENQEYQL